MRILLNRIILITVLSSIIIINNPVSAQSFLLEETFEDNNVAARGWYDFSGTPDIVYDTDKGSNVLEFNFTKAGSTTPRTKILRKLFEETDTVYVKYSVKYSNNWQWPLKTKPVRINSTWLRMQTMNG